MLKKMNDSFKDKINKPLVIITFITLILFLIWVIIFKAVGITYYHYNVRGIKEQIIHNINLNIIDRFNYQWGYHVIPKTFLIDIIPNIIFFIPFGMLLSVIRKNKFISNFFIVLGSVFCVELFQLFTGIGGFCFIDILYNITGFFIGFGIYKLLVYLLEKKNLFNIVTNYCCLIFIIIVIPFTIYGLINVIKNFSIFMPCFKIENYKNLFRY